VAADDGPFELVVAGPAARAIADIADRRGATRGRRLWNLLGRAVDGPLAGPLLDAVPHVDTFWFAWAAFRPDSAVIE